MENNCEIVCGVRPIKNVTPSTGKSTLCHNILIAQQTKIFVLHGKLFLLEQAEHLCEALMGIQGAGTWWGLQGGSAPLSKKMLYLVS